MLSYFCRLALYLSLEYFPNFLSKLYIPLWLGKICKSMLFRLLENRFASLKVDSMHFYSYPQEKFSPRFLSSPPGEEKLFTSPHRQHFFENMFPLGRKYLVVTMTAVMQFSKYELNHS